MRFSAIRFNYFRKPRSYVNRYELNKGRNFIKRHEYVLKPYSELDKDGSFSGERKLNKKQFNQPYDEQESRFIYQDDHKEDESIDEKEDHRTSIPYEVTNENKYELLNQVIAPLSILKYEQQLKAKQAAIAKIMMNFGSKLRRFKSHVILDDNGLPCPVSETVPSPRITEYRNKDEFTIWPGLDGNRKTVGFLLGEPSKHKNVVCIEPNRVNISKPNHRMLASLFQKYLREHSPYDVCTNLAEGGHWRRFAVRSNEANEHMIICQMNPQDLTLEELEDEKMRIKSFFEGQIANDFNIVSAYFQAPKGVRSTHTEAPFQLIFGEDTIKENIHNINCVISPESFFQVNTLAAARLYGTILDEIEPSKEMTVIDCCSGVGLMSMIAARKVRRVIAIEQSTQAHEDAKRNATLNKVNNITFINSNVETVLPKLSDEFYGQKVAVILNPGRGGVHHSVISTIRSFNPVSRVVYVSCKPAGVSFKNFVHLSMKSTNKDPGLPLLPVSAIPVDMFPQTEHCELVLTFDRFL